MIPTNHPVQEAFRRIPPAPRPGVILDLVFHAEKGNIPEFWTVRAYRENLSKLDLSAESMVVVHKWISDIMSVLRSIDEMVYFEISDHLPREVR